MNCFALATGLTLLLTVASAPAPSEFQRLALDAPQEALIRGREKLAEPNLAPEQRQSILIDMSRAASQVSEVEVESVAGALDALAGETALPSASALAGLLRAQVLLEKDQVKRGLELAHESAARLRALDDPYWHALADTEVCDALLTAGRPDAAQPHCLRAYQAWPGLKREYELARTENLLQWQYQKTGDITRAIELAKSARARLVALGTTGGVALLDDNLSALYLASGKPQLALEYSRRALAHELAAGKLQHTIASRHNVAEALAALGRNAEALDELELALAESRKRELGRLTASLLDAKARISERAGQPTVSLAALRELIALNARLSTAEVDRAALELEAHYGSQVREREIFELKQEAEMQALRLSAAEAKTAHEQSRASYYALILLAATAIGFLGVLLVVLRLNLLKRLNAALTQANRSRAEMLAMAAHEIRNPLAAIGGLIDMALHRTADPRARGLLETARATTAGLVHTAEDYLDHSQLALGRVQLRDRAFDLPQLLANVIRLFQAEVAGRPLGLRMVMSPSTPTWVSGDAERLQQVLTNLLGNAVKFTERGEVLLEAMPDVDGRTRFAISDTGPGIAEPELQRLLCPFERGAVVRGQRGAGLGLSIASQLVEKLGGRLQVQSAPGHGSRFEFAIPLSVTAAPANAEVPLTAENSGMRVLLVDDDSAIRELLSAQLESLNIDHRVAATIDDALVTWRDFQPDTVLIDLHLDRENGIDLIRRIRDECGPRPSPRCLIHSASPPSSQGDRLPEDWGIEWVRKPMPLVELGRLLGSDATPSRSTAVQAATARESHAIAG
ncbi:ATP-binding response regulator [Tahibacter amnicola]|uniref:histidine kinase n=1 Tax=Tahibacter amnicola TaxID=2976241 RepID=A0ABY6BB09_9GAMM|nr:ATP-binding protein [Tahibacter amnicola]UXI66879.1 ATP-binding protein [Tahibacter amnicola]